MHIPEFLRGQLASGQRQTLEPLARVLARLGQPQQGLCGVLVAGTNGKGSTCLFVQSILQAAGVSTGLFLSPSLRSLRELVRLDGVPLAPQAFRTLCLEVVAKAGEDRLTLFELVTAAAFLAFSRARVTVAVLEVGMGGRWDATRLLDPELAVVTSLALDHASDLGGSLETIAWHKLGVAHEGRPLLTAALGPGLQALEQAVQSSGMRLELEVLGRAFGLDPVEGSLDARVRLARGEAVALRFWDDSSVLNLNRVRLGPRGLHQQRNAALAVRVVRLLEQRGRLGDVRVAVEALAEGLAAHGQPGRLDRLQFPGPSPTPFWLDGAHNPEGMRSLLASLEVLEPGRRLHGLLAVYADKDVAGMLELLLPRLDRLILTVTDAPRCMPVEALRGCARAVASRLGWNGELLEASSVADGLRGLRQGLLLRTGPAGVVCGTLSLVAPVYHAVGRALFPAWEDDSAGKGATSGETQESTHPRTPDADG